MNEEGKCKRRGGEDCRIIGIAYDVFKMMYAQFCDAREGRREVKAKHLGTCSIHCIKVHNDGDNGEHKVSNKEHQEKNHADRKVGSNRLACAHAIRFRLVYVGAVSTAD